MSVSTPYRCPICHAFHYHTRWCDTRSGEGDLIRCNPKPSPLIARNQSNQIKSTIGPSCTASEDRDKPHSLLFLPPGPITTYPIHHHRPLYNIRTNLRIVSRVLLLLPSLPLPLSLPFVFSIILQSARLSLRRLFSCLMFSAIAIAL